MRILAVDWGERRIGLAISDPMGVIATGLPTLSVRGHQEGIKRVIEVAEEHEASRIVVGMPLRLSGEVGAAAESAQRFADDLAAQSRFPIETYDERLTTALSARHWRESHGGKSGTRGGKSGGRGGKREKGHLDRGAAIALLQSYLQRLASRGESA